MKKRIMKEEMMACNNIMIQWHEINEGNESNVEMIMIMIKTNGGVFLKQWAAGIDKWQ